MTDFNILIATPSYNGNVCSRYTESLLFTCNLLLHLNIKYTVKFINNQIVTRARNMLSNIFMYDEQYTHMLFIDADIVWNPKDVLKLLYHKKDCVIGVYPNKGYYWNNDKLILNPSSQFVLSEFHNLSNEHESLVKVKKAATGFMLLTKSALKRIEKDIDTFKLPGNDKIENLYNYFDCNIVDNDYLTEDYYFSYLFLKNGGTIYADTSISLLHIGNHEYGSLLK